MTGRMVTDFTGLRGCELMVTKRSVIVNDIKATQFVLVSAGTPLITGEIFLFGSEADRNTAEVPLKSVFSDLVYFTSRDEKGTTYPSVVAVKQHSDIEIELAREMLIQRVTAESKDLLDFSTPVPLFLVPLSCGTSPDFIEVGSSIRKTYPSGGGNKAADILMNEKYCRQLERVASLAQITSADEFRFEKQGIVFAFYFGD